jgi:tetratricopeptide (TPR) repeat protein
MNTLSVLQQALEHHRSGRLNEAEQLYRQALLADPANGDAHHLLGMIALARGCALEAINSLSAAIARNPNAAQYHEHLGTAYLAAGRTAEAVASCRDAVRLAPGSAAAHNELGNAIRAQGDVTESEDCYRTALKLDPQLAAAHNNLGNALADQHRLPEALVCFQQAAQLNGPSAEIYFNLGNCHVVLGHRNESIAAYRQAVAIRPELVRAHYNLARELYAAGQSSEAVASYREALRLEPGLIDAHNDLGAALHALGDLEEAKASFGRALALRPDHESATQNLARILIDQRKLDEAEDVYENFVQLQPDSVNGNFFWAGRMQANGKFAEAAAIYRRVLELAPDHAEAHYYLGTCLLATGQFTAGWQEYEWRLKGPDAAPPHPQPIWDGQPLHGQSILVYSEWAYGDTLQFVRYVPMVVERGGNVVLEVQPGLIPLLGQSGFAQLIARGQRPFPDCPLCVPILSLARIFETTVETIPAPIPYLRADPRRVDIWRSRLSAYPGYRIGVCWGGSDQAMIERRSMSLAEFAPLTRVSGVRLISLQKGAQCEEIKEWRDRLGIIDFGDELDADGAFLDTSAMMRNVDLVISCDTSTAHLAGALGTQVWMPLSAGNAWHWMQRRSDSPWYPTMRLFRQSCLDDWNEPFQRMAAELD